MAHPTETTLKTLADILPGVPLSAALLDTAISGLTIDSREVQQGYVFVAVQGVQTHGSRHIASAVANGAVLVLQEASNNQYDVSHQQSVPVVFVPDLEKQLSKIAGDFYNHPTSSLPVIAVTGTNGKTTISQLYAQLMALSGEQCGVVGTMGYGVYRTAEISELNNTGMTTPDPIRVQRICAELLSQGSQQLIMEVSSHGLEQNRVQAMSFDVAIFTNLTHDHLDYHGTMEAYGHAKAKLFAMPSVTHAVINIDDEFGQQLYDSLRGNKNSITYSVKKSADVYLQNVVFTSGITTARLFVGSKEYALETHLVGEFNLSNLLAILSALYAQDPDNEDQMRLAIANVTRLMPVCGRMEAIENTINRQVVVDYAHTPDALKNALQSLQAINHGKVICVFGCGGDRDKDKRPSMAAIAEHYADNIIVTSDNPRHEDPAAIIEDICRGFHDDNYRVIPDREQAIWHALESSLPGDIILIAGKGHEDYQLIGNTKNIFIDQKVARLALRKMEAEI